MAIPRGTSVLPLPVIFDWDAPAVDFLRSLQGTQAEMKAHSPIDLSQLSIADAPSLLRTALVIHDSSVSASEIFSRLSETPMLRPDLVLLANKNASGNAIRVDVRFNSQAILQLDVDVLLDHFGSAMNALRKTPSSPLRDISLISEKEMAHLVYTLNPTFTAITSATTVTALISAQVQKTPQKIAVRLLTP